MCKNLPNNPLRQETVDEGQKQLLRHFRNGFIPFNYGFLPQTIEDPVELEPMSGFPGDGDPLDVVELSETPLPVGALCRAKVLGAMCLIDQNETDWKILVVNEDSELTRKLNCF